MRAVRLYQYHQDPVVEEVPEPTIAGPLDVIVKIGGAGVCRTDLHIMEGQWAAAMSPTFPTHSAMGTARPRCWQRPRAGDPGAVAGAVRECQILIRRSRRCSQLHELARVS